MLNDTESNVIYSSADATDQLVCNGVGLKNYHHIPAMKHETCRCYIKYLNCLKIQKP